MGQVLSVSQLEKQFEVGRTPFSQTKTVIKAVDKVSFDLEEGEAMGIVGESGSGKSTLARCLLLLEKPDRGVIKFLGQQPLMMRKGMEVLRERMQIIFQDPYSSLNPRKTVGETIREPLLVHHIANRKDVTERTAEILKNVGLYPDFLNKYPHEMSGGQRQRVAIGRALATNPFLLVADEPVSSLDVSIQAQIINLFLDIREQSKISMVFISHDLNVVRFLCDEILVMYKGRVLEMGRKDEIFLHPLHPYTRMLMAASQGELCRSKAKDERPLAEESCIYCQRCDTGDHLCTMGRPELVGTKEHSVACFRPHSPSLEAKIGPGRMPEWL